MFRTCRAGRRSEAEGDIQGQALLSRPQFEPCRAKTPGSPASSVGATKYERKLQPAVGLEQQRQVPRSPRRNRSQCWRDRLLRRLRRAWRATRHCWCGACRMDLCWRAIELSCSCNHRGLIFNAVARAASASGTVSSTSRRSTAMARGFARQWSGSAAPTSTGESDSLFRWRPWRRRSQRSRRR